ncbi:hypothetical protein [Flavobacterium humidisoli]|uniref:Uncharacterized protein n=1 Tax=Flavobacterium humidisoli TaxID=2937442 RepID=A0ABY4LTT5_9FLAO|nr:hypothetical protein [Flavobacterium humidisoli]UPZ16500.1 hypothetical protein M0M44_03980 [Flavobacterium humidisoli]
MSQEASEINKILEIPNTLEYKQEIRIYKDSIGNKTVVLRIFKDQINEWIAQKFWYSKNIKSVTKIDEIRFPKESIGKLKPKDPELIWLNLLITNVEFLPNMEAIRYKFGKPKIDSDRGEQVTSRTKKHVLDGVGYKVYVRNGKNTNSFSFDNPKTYLGYYPTVDELISYNELLSVLEKEFSF